MSDYKCIAKKKNGYGYCRANDINYLINNVNRWCGNDFDLYVDGVKIDNPQEYLNRYKPKTLESKIVDMCLKKDDLEQENQQLKSVIDEVRELTLKEFALSEKEQNKIRKSYPINEYANLLIGQEYDIQNLLNKINEILDKAKVGDK